MKIICRALWLLVGVPLLVALLLAYYITCPLVILISILSRVLRYYKKHTPLWPYVKQQILLSPGFVYWIKYVFDDDYSYEEDQKQEG